MATKHSSLTWPDRLALIDAYKPTDQAICATFGTTPNELTSARGLAATGTIVPSASFDVARYGNPFEPGGMAAPVKQPTATVHAMPETAAKRKKIPQKRGRKGDKIAIALRSVPTKPVPVDEFAKSHDVSLAVLRQSKRFIEKLGGDANNIGTIYVRQDKESKQLMIWRELPKQS